MLFDSLHSVNTWRGFPARVFYNPYKDTRVISHLNLLITLRPRMSAQHTHNTTQSTHTFTQRDTAIAGLDEEDPFSPHTYRYRFPPNYSKHRNLPRPGLTGDFA